MEHKTIVVNSQFWPSIYIYIYILIASFPQDFCLVPRVLRVLPIPFFVSMVKASREPK